MHVKFEHHNASFAKVKNMWTNVFIENWADIRTKSYHLFCTTFEDVLRFELQGVGLPWLCEH